MIEQLKLNVIYFLLFCIPVIAYWVITKILLKSFRKTPDDPSFSEEKGGKTIRVLKKVVSAVLIIAVVACGASVLYKLFAGGDFDAQQKAIIDEYEALEQKEHDCKDNESVPYVRHGVYAYYAWRKEHRERIRDSARKAETAGYYAAKKACKWVISYENAEGRDDREHGQHLFEKTEKCSEGIEQEWQCCDEEKFLWFESGWHISDECPYTSYVIHDLKGCRYDQKEKGEHDKGKTVRWEKNKDRSKNTLKDRDAAALCILRIA